MMTSIRNSLPGRIKILKVAALILLLVNFLGAKGQDPDIAKTGNFFVIVQAGYNIGVSNIKINNNASLKNNVRMYRIRAIAGYFVTPRLSLGLGAGLDGFHEPSYNTMPATADVRYFFGTSPNHPFVNLNTGYSIKVGENFKSGLYEGLSIGYIFSKRRKTPLLLSAGIDFHQINESTFYLYDQQRQSFDYVQSNIWIKSVSFNLALLFK